MEPTEAPEPEGDRESSPDTAKDLDQDEIQQQEWRKAFIEQQRRMRCPGCGEADEHF